MGQSGTAHAGSFDHENVVLDYVCLEEVLVNYNNSFRLCIEAFDRAKEIEK